VSYTNVNQGPGTPGGFQAEVRVTNTSGTAVNGWQVGWSFTAGQQISQLWGGIVDQDGPDVTVTNETWNPVIQANGGSVNFGLIASWQGSNPPPGGFTLNGTACAAG
jgi:endo-1,4-beta-xylanase